MSTSFQLPYVILCDIEYIVNELTDQISIYLDKCITADLADQIGIYLDEYIAILADQISIYLSKYTATPLRFPLSNGILLRQTYTTMSMSFQPTYVILCDMHLEAVSYVPEDLTPIYTVTTIPLSDMRRGMHHAFSTFEFVSALTQFLPTVPRMTSIYSAEDFDANGNFISGGAFMDLVAGGGKSGPVPSINEINWDDPSLYTMPLIIDVIAAITEDIATINTSVPPTHTLSPQPFETSAQDLEGLPSTTEAEMSGTGGQMSELLRKGNVSSWAAQNQT
ncbi:uncharacterized protein EDB91DRAFT_1253059 [Suillus paluster]|uniref:uncharacterized protein n=1 Tax=Suillus paluster TaxID=48578 RepID=UPI001B85B83D|nr:uncharacterized protein EDB91DRAFT_1253059 [Suillus paluster]KAG1729313.1 hypothetical protein EDB91DRAFT_1253059 [Suillus paluster]